MRGVVLSGVTAFDGEQEGVRFSGVMIMAVSCLSWPAEKTVFSWGACCHSREETAEEEVAASASTCTSRPYKKINRFMFLVFFFFFFCLTIFFFNCFA
jgi:hypothetical protein